MAGAFQPVAFCENNLYARAVLKKHWSEVPQYDDIRTLTGDALARDGVGRIDVVAGGWPCQPHSVAGKRRSSDDDRDLWHEFARLIGETRPRWVVAENVRGLLSSADPVHGRGKGGFFGRVLRDLAELGFDAEWHCFPASSVGAHHRRERVFIVAYPSKLFSDGSPVHTSSHSEGSRPVQQSRDGSSPAHVADAEHDRRERRHPSGRPTQAAASTGARGAASLANPHSAGPFGGVGEGSGEAEYTDPAHRRSDVAHADSTGLALRAGVRCDPRAELSPAERDSGTPSWAGGEWEQPSPVTVSAVRGMADGFPGRVDRLRCLGNAVVPQQAAVIGRAIAEAEAHFERFGVMPGQIVQPRHIYPEALA